MLELNKKPRWFIAVVIAAHLLVLWVLLGQKFLLRMSAGGSSMDVSQFDISAPKPAAPSPLPVPRFLAPPPLAAGVFDLGPAVLHDEPAVHTGIRTSASGTGQGQAQPSLPAQAAGTDGIQGEDIATLSSGMVRYLVPPRVSYPAGSANVNEAGTAKLRILFGPDGNVLDVNLLASTGFPRLDEAALEGARRAVLAPIPGRNARVYVTQDIVFIIP